MSRSLAQVRVEVETRLGDSTNAVWSDAEINGLIQEGYDELVRTTGILWKRTNPAGLIPTIATGTYTLPTDLELIERLAYQNRRIFPITPEEAQIYYGPLYRTVEGTLVAYIMDSDGIGTIRYVRVPAATGAATDVYIEYQYRGATLSADGTLLEIPDRYVKYVRHYVLWKALERDGAGQDLKLAEHYQTRYMDGIGRMKRRKNAFTTERRVSLSGDRPAGQVPLPRLPWNYGVTLKGRGY